MAMSLYQADEVPTTLLHIWREINGIDPWMFNQIHGGDAEFNPNEHEVVIQPERDTINEALIQSYSELQDVLGYSLIPQFFSEDIPLSRKWNHETQTLQTKLGYLQGFGQETKVLIEAGASITYSKSNASLAVNDTATITVTDASAVPGEIRVYFKATDQRFDGNGTAGDELYRIVPLTVTEAADTFTITGHRSLFVKPSQFWDTPYLGAGETGRNRADATNAAHFITEVDVYRVYRDTSTQITFLTDPIYYKTTGLGGDLEQTGIARVVDKQLGLFTVRKEDCYEYIPQYVRVYYEAGFDLQNGRMDRVLATALTRHANSIMAGTPGIKAHAMLTARYQEDKSLLRAEDRTDTGNPLAAGIPSVGTEAAWKAIRRRLNPRGGKLTSTWRG